MKRDVLINIRGTYNCDDDEVEPEVIDLFTTGTLETFEDHYLISYIESEATGFQGSFTTLKVEDKDNALVIMSRTGEANTQLIVEDGVRHQCYYDAGYGEMLIGVSGHSVQSTLAPTGGDVSFRYSLDINAMMASENEMIISVKERVQ